MRPLERAFSFPLEDNQFVRNDTLENIGVKRIIRAEPMQVKNYEELMDLVSKLAFFNRGYVMFFRGQAKEHTLGSHFPSIYPTYYRECIKNKKSTYQLEEVLYMEEEILKIKNHHRKPRFHGAFSVMESHYVRWALLQHYNICDTPLIDVTQSLHVAASFALMNKKKTINETGIIYVLALPWPTKNYHNNSEEELFLVRLAGITPPQAKRPYRQEAFAVMSQDVDMKQLDQFERHDFAQRLVCKFEINNSPEFWGDAIKPLPESFLVPKQDAYYKFMQEVIKNNEVLTER